MQITVTVPDDLALQAQARGLTVETYVVSLIEQVAQRDATPEEECERRRQAVRDMLAFREKYHLTLGPGLRIKDLIHERHKY